MRNQFTFYKSFDDVIEDLSDKQIAEYIKVMLDVQFLRVKIDDVEFTDKTLSIVWKSQKHSISTSIKGYLDGQKRDTVKNPYLGVYGNNSNPALGVRQQEKEEEKGEEKGEVKEKDKKLPTKKPKDFLYESDFEQLWKIYNVGDKWAAYKSWHFRKKDYTGEELIKALKLEDTKQFGKRHFSTVLNSDLDEILKATPIKKPHPYESGL